MLSSRPENANSRLAALSSGLDTALQQWQETATTALQQSDAIPLKQDVVVRFTDFSNRSDGGTLITLVDQKETAKQAQQMKLASLGKLTAGVAHEVRNPLSAIHQAAPTATVGGILPE